MKYKGYEIEDKLYWSSKEWWQYEITGKNLFIQCTREYKNFEGAISAAKRLIDKLEIKE